MRDSIVDDIKSHRELNIEDGVVIINQEDYKELKEELEKYLKEEDSDKLFTYINGVPLWPTYKIPKGEAKFIPKETIKRLSELYFGGLI